MAITFKRPQDKTIIDLSGPSGTAISLLGQAALWLHQQGKSSIEVGDVLGHMMSSDYENMIQVFNNHFGEFCELLR